MNRIALFALGAFLAAETLSAATTSATVFGEYDRALVDRKIMDWQPSARERRWEQIGWAKDIRDAKRLAKASGRPVFLFTHDGRLNVGRC